MKNIQTGFADVNGTKLYYELAGTGTPFIMIHAGIADSRMWNNEFTHFADSYQVLRFDMRGYGKSKAIDGDFNIQDDFEALLKILQIDPPMILMGCSIGAGLAVEYALENPEQVQALILVGGYPRGYESTASDPEHLFDAVDKAVDDKDFDLAIEIEAQIWVDGMGRTPDEIDLKVRQLALDMNRIVLENDTQDIGTHVSKNYDAPPAEILHQLTMPTLIIVGDKDLPTIVDAGDYMQSKIPNSQKHMMPNTAHIPNMEQPKLFRDIVSDFLQNQ